MFSCVAKRDKNFIIVSCRKNHALSHAFLLTQKEQIKHHCFLTQKKKTATNPSNYFIIAVNNTEASR